MYNPFEPNDKSQLQNLFSYFVTGQGLREDCCIVFAHCKSKDATRNFSSPLQNIPFVSILRCILLYLYIYIYEIPVISTCFLCWNSYRFHSNK